MTCFIFIFIYFILVTVADNNCHNDYSNVICIGLGTFGQSLCRQAIANNLTILAAFNMHSTASQPISKLFHIKENQIECYKDIRTMNIDKLTQFISDNKNKDITALFGVDSCLNYLDIVLPIIKQCLSNSINVVSIMTPILLKQNLEYEYKEINRIGTENNAYFVSSGLSSFLLEIFPFEIVNDENINYKEITGRITCNADYIAYIHRNEKPNIWYDWFIGERVDDYYNKAPTLKFFKFLQNELDVLTETLLRQLNLRDNAPYWTFTFNSKAIYDQHGETLSAFLNRQIETGRITAIRYNARLSNIHHESIHIVVKMGLFKEKKERELLTPCHIQWEFLDENGESIKEVNIKGIDIIAAIMNNAIQNIIRNRDRNINGQKKEL